MDETKAAIQVVTPETLRYYHDKYVVTLCAAATDEMIDAAFAETEE